MGVQFPGKKRYVTLEYPLTHSHGVLLGLPTLLHFFLSLGMVIASVADVCLHSEVLQPGGSWSSSGSGSMYASNHQVECDAIFPLLGDHGKPVGGLCVDPVKHLVVNRELQRL